MQREEQGERCYGLLPSRQLIHVAEPLHGGHRVELHASKVRLLLVVKAQVGVTTEGMLTAQSEVLKSFDNARIRVGAERDERLRNFSWMWPWEAAELGLCGLFLCREGGFPL